MRIAIVGARGKDTMEYNLWESFTFQGHHCEIFDYFDLFFLFNNRYSSSIARTFDKIIRTYSEGYDSKLFAKLARHVEDYNPDLIICTYRFINPSLVKLLKKPTRKIVHVNPDQMVTLGYQQVFASDYDAWFVKDPYMLKFMVSNMKLNTFLYQEAFNKREHIKPNISKVECENEIGIDVITYGTVYPYRERMLKAVVDSGIDLKIYGVIPNRFYNHTLDKQFQNRYITGEEKSKILYGSKIVFNQMHYAEVESVNCRFFETNGIGAFQLSDYRPILNQLLPIDPELVSFKTIDDGIDKINYYLKHPDERYDISMKIYNWFADKYTYDSLTSYILAKL